MMTVRGGRRHWRMKGRKKENWTLINSWTYPPFLFSFTLTKASSCSPKAFRPGGAEAVMSVLEAWGRSSAFPRDHRDRSLRESAENHPKHETQLYFPLVSLYFQQSVFSPGKCPGQTSLVGYRPWGPQRVADGWDKLAVTRGDSLMAFQLLNVPERWVHTPCSPTCL